MAEVAYYDTCVFELQWNSAHEQSAACQALVDVPRIRWTVAFGEISMSEAPIREWLDAFEIQCALQGVAARRVRADEAATVARHRRQLGKRLRQLGLGAYDWKHLCGAAAVSADALVTDDRDFWDPAAKRTGQRPTDGPVCRAAWDEFGITIERPSTAAPRLRAL